MKVTIVEPRGSGGMAHYAYQLCNAMSQFGHEITLITSQQYELESYPRLFQLRNILNLWTQHTRSSAAGSNNRVARAGLKIFRSIRRIFRGMRLYAEWAKLTTLLVRERPDIIQFGEIEFPFEAIFLQYLKSRGLVLTQICHEFELRERKSGLLVQINNRLLENVFTAFTAIFFLSQNNADHFHEVYPAIPTGRFHIISHGNERIFTTGENKAQNKKALLERYGITGNEKVVLFFGTITPSKGIPDLLCAFEKIYAQISSTRLVIAGMPLKYIDENELYESASRLGIAPVTTFDSRYIPMDEVEPLMELASVVVFPYLSATQSGSIQAAYSFGKPVVATRVGGLPDVVEEGKSGFLVDSHSPDQLSAAILRILNDPRLAEEMGHYAKTLSETRFGWGPIAENVLSVYQRFPNKG